MTTLKLQQKRADLIGRYLRAKMAEDIYYNSPNQGKYRFSKHVRIQIWKELRECK